MGKQRDDKKRLETAAALLTLAAESRDTEELQAECPAAEEFAAFSEGSGTELALSAFFTHLEGCESCYRQWLILKEEEVRRDHSSTASRLKKYSYIGSALALAASIVVFLNIREPAEVLIQFDKNEALEETKVEGGALPSVQEIEGGIEKPASETMLRQDTEAGKVEDVLGSKQEKSISEPEADKSLKVYKKAKEVYSPTQQKVRRKVKRLEKSLPQRAARLAASPAAESDTFSGFNSWVADLRKGCLIEQQEISDWKSIVERGERIHEKETLLLSTSELSLLSKLLLQINQMDESSISAQCEQILQTLAEEEESR